MTPINRRPLREVLDERGYIRGPFGSALRRGELLEKGIPVYEQQHAITGSREFRFFIDDNKFQELARFQVRPNDLIISCSGTVGRISVIAKDDPLGIISQALLILRPNRQVMLPEFLYYFLSTNQGQESLLQASHGSVQVNIAPRAVVERIEVPDLPLSQQRTIAAVLGALDDKIEVNRRMNQTLEQMAQALFKSWFVDFDPVHANRSGEAMPGLAPEVQALFPNAFEDSALGEIPQGWRVEQVSNVAEVTDYVANGSFESLRKNVQYLDTLDYAVLVRLVDFNSGWNGDYVYVNKASYDFLRKSSLQPGDVVISNVGANAGTVFLAPDLGKPLTLGPNAIVIKPEYGKLFYYYYFTSNNGQEQIQSIISGSAQPKFNKTDFRSLRLVIPTEEVLRLFSHTADNVWRQQASNSRQDTNLIQIRNALLPKLLSGEVRVREAEKIVENVL